MRLTLDGNDWSKFVEGLEDLTLTNALNSSDRSTSISVSGTLEFTGPANEYLYQKFFQEPKQTVADGVMVKVNLYLECCDYTEPFTFYLDHGLVELCDCSITGNLKYLDDDSECRAILRDKIYWQDNGFLSSVPFYDVPYCEEASIITKLLTIVYCIISPILLVLEIIEEVINGILDVIDFLVFWKDLDWEVNIPSLDDAFDVLQGCGKKHPSPAVVDVIRYNVERCGLEFNSHLLDYGFYRNVLLLQAQNEEGCEDCDYIESNMLNKTTIQIMNDLRPVWNADYRIIDGVLYFGWERWIKDKLKDNVLCDVENEFDEGDSDQEPCYNLDTNLPAYLRLEYTRDPIDLAGNKRMDTYRLDGKEPGNYSEIVEWNDPPSEYQNGEQTVIIPFSPVAFTDDGRERCRDNLFRKVDMFRLGVKPHQVVLTHGMSAMPKLILMWQLNDDFDVWKQPTGEKAGCAPQVTCIGMGGVLLYDVYEYNRFLWVNEGIHESVYIAYYKYEDPRGGERELINLDPFTFAFDCDQLRMVMKYGVNLAVKTKYGYGIPERINIDFGNNTMTIQGVKI